MRQSFFSSEGAMASCRHFTGVQNPTCKVGIAYESLQSSGGLPCLAQGDGTCPHYDPYTKEEEAELERVIQEAVVIYMERLVSGLCVACGEKPSHMVQLSRAYYAEPCGHRQGIGSAKEWNKRWKE